MTLAPASSHGTFRPLLRLALPVLAEQILVMMVGMSDRALAGRYLDTPHLAAMNLMAYLLWLMQGTFAVLAIGGTALVARFIGGRQTALARRVAHQSLLLGAVVSVAAMVFWWEFGGVVIGVMGLPPDSAELAAMYLRTVLPCLPLMMAQAVGVACLRGAGDMISGFLAMTLVNAVNISASWALVLGWGLAPKMGWRGLAVGTAMGYIAGGIVVLALLAMGRYGLRIRWRLFRPDAALMRRLLKVGIPGGADMLLLIGCQLWFVALVNQLGNRAAAAHGVAIGIESFAYLPGFAFQAAAATLAGQSLGAGDHRRAARSVLYALSVGGGLMGGMGVLFYTQADALPFVFLGASGRDIARLVAPLLRTVAVGMVPLAATMILTGALRGAGDTRWPLMFTLVGFLGVRIPLAYWLAFDTVALPWHLGSFGGHDLGVVGAWYAMLADLTVRAVLVVYRFFHGGWKWIEV